MESLTDSAAFQLLWSGLLVALALAGLGLVTWREKQERQKRRAPLRREG